VVTDELWCTMRLYEVQLIPLWEKVAHRRLCEFSIFQTAQVAAPSLRANLDAVIPGWRVSARPGISRFRVRCGACHRAGQRPDPLASPRNDGVCSNPIPDARSRPRGALRPSHAFIFRPIEGVGNAGCPLHPRPRVHFVLVERTRVTTSTPERPAFPHAMVLTAYVGLSPVTGLFCHRRLRICFV
jgi:hypothetical protein